MGNTANYYSVNGSAASVDILSKLQKESFYKGSRKHQLFVEGTLDRKIYEDALTRVFSDYSSKDRQKIRFGELKDSYDGKNIHNTDLALDTNVYTYGDGTFQQFTNPYYSGQADTAFGWILNLIQEYKESIDNGESDYSNIDCFGIIDKDIVGHNASQDLPVSCPMARDHETLLMKWALPFMCASIAEKCRKNEVKSVSKNLSAIMYFTMQQGMLQEISMNYEKAFGKGLDSRKMSKITGLFFKRNYTSEERWKHGAPVALPDDFDDNSSITDYLDSNQGMTDFDFDHPNAARYLRNEFSKKAALITKPDLSDVVEWLFNPKKKESLSKARIKEIMDMVFEYSNGHIMYFLVSEYIGEYLKYKDNGIEKTVESDADLEDYFMSFFAEEDKFSRFASMSPLSEYIDYRKHNEYSIFKVLNKVSGQYVFQKIK